jgi:hypothetical protein
LREGISRFAGGCRKEVRASCRSWHCHHGHERTHAQWGRVSCREVMSSRLSR